MDPSRFLRQILLPEIGASGQDAIAAAEAPVLGPSLAHEVARRYAEGAGFGHLTEGTIPSELEVDVADAAARDVCLGARAALRAILDAVPGARPPVVR